MSREEADQKDKEIRSDDIRLKMALDESQDVSLFECTYTFSVILINLELTQSESQFSKMFKKMFIDCKMYGNQAVN